MRKHGLARSVLAFCLVFFSSVVAYGGPPFMTDDPEPVALHHYEFYVFSTLAKAPDGYSVQVPAFEFNIGAAPNLQLHVVAPLALSVPTEGHSHYGMGDIELGAKYRFLDQKQVGFQLGTFPMLEVPSGSAQRGLGNGSTWAKLPIWVQRDWGKWTSYGGAGWVVNHAPGMRDHAFFGWQAQRELSKKLTLGAEWFDAGRESVDGRSSHFVNAGGFYDFNENFLLLFTLGHTICGEAQTVGYLGLYWTWGSDKGAKKDSESLLPPRMQGSRRSVASSAFF